jgi:hypothetical protein
MTHPESMNMALNHLPSLGNPSNTDDKALREKGRLRGTGVWRCPQTITPPKLSP